MDLEPALEPSDITVTYTTSEETNRLPTNEDSPERQDSSHYTWVTVSMSNRLIVTTFRCMVHLNMKKVLGLCNKPSLLEVFVDFPSYRISFPLSFPLFLFSLSLPPPPILPPSLPSSLPPSPLSPITSSSGDEEQPSSSTLDPTGIEVSLPHDSETSSEEEDRTSSDSDEERCVCVWGGGGRRALLASVWWGWMWGLIHGTM